MTTIEEIGIDVSGRVIVLQELQADLEAGGVEVPNGLTIAGPPTDPVFPPPLPGALPPPCPDGSRLFTYDDDGNPSDLPPGALPIVAAYTPPAGRSAPVSATHERIAAATTLAELKAAVLEAIP
jgi:hypothetical protein